MLNPETKRGVAVVFLFAAAALLLLSFFRLAGTLGTTLDHAAGLAFGWDRFLLPFLCMLVGYALLYPERNRFGGWNYAGMILFFLSFNGLLNLMILRAPDPDDAIEVLRAGGWVGQALAPLLLSSIGFWAALVVLGALLLIGVLLLFNTSLRHVFTAHTHVFGWMTERLHRQTSIPLSSESDIESEAANLDEEPGVETDEAEGEQTQTRFRTKPLAGASESEPEKVLTTKRRRQTNLPLELLEYRGAKPNSGDIERNREIIQRTFAQFGIPVEMADVSVGPTVTQFTLRPAEGVKLARIVSLQNDLALALAAHPLRIEAPIPGKSLVGIEIPNQTVATVALRELLESKAFHARSNQTTVPLGKDVSGKIWVAGIQKMPHLLVAGATGSGKSVCLNTLIVSLLYENGPDDLKFIMVDPKRVELTIYEGIPHLLIPPVTKVDDTVNALKWVVREMERRLDLLSKMGARDIDSYNEKVEERMPRIMVVIDELADLMAASGHEVEATIVRIAQMARAVGIHLILATQRPSVDVITGTIKANFPARIAFAVASQTDSRTILDTAGADKLLGRGDMLYTCAELSKPVRLQGAFISESEISKVVGALKKQGTPDYNYAVTEKAGSGSVFSRDEDEDPLLNEAAQTVIQGGKASTSFLQRRLKIGYSRAARLMDVLEQHGVIGPPDGAKPRDVLIDEWPPGSDIKDAMPTVQDELEEAQQGFDAPVEQDEDRQEQEEDPSPFDEDKYLKSQEGEYPDEKS